MASATVGGNARPGGGAGKGAALIDSQFSDTVVLARVARGGLYVGAAGTVKFTAVDGTIDTWTMAAKSILPIAIKQVWVTGTTATDVHAIY
jgi:hypothetical protein